MSDPEHLNPVWFVEQMNNQADDLRAAAERLDSLAAMLANSLWFHPTEEDDDG
jgi:hypothetical protein